MTLGCAGFHVYAGRRGQAPVHRIAVLCRALLAKCLYGWSYERTAEEVKIQIGTALPLERELSMEVRGRDLIAGLPRTIPITSSEVMEAVEAPLQQLVAAVRQVLEQTPPELGSDVAERGKMG